jgi:hypothetical protein
LSKEYTIWCDESVKKGKHYSNFYGGVLVSSLDKEEVIKTLEEACLELNIQDEIKWQKVNHYHFESYLKLMDAFFNLVNQNKIKVRIMFMHNATKANNLKDHHRENEYFLLYYQFVKHAFGLHYSNETEDQINIRMYFDYMPDTLSKRQQFKEYIKGLEATRSFQLAKLKIKKQDITEVDSKHHIIMQFLDVVLGSMAFRLNDKHKEKQEGQRIRGIRTRYKEKLYKHINKKIREIYAGFNIGESTGTLQMQDRWLHSYRHWRFVPAEFEIDESHYK